jgi:hypothetical protein
MLRGCLPPLVLLVMAVYVSADGVYPTSPVPQAAPPTFTAAPVPAPYTSPVPYSQPAPYAPPAPLVGVPVVVFPAPAWDVYFRTDYFHWHEQIENFPRGVNEDGPLFTLGLERSGPLIRGRAEVFGGSMIYAGGVQYPDGASEPSTATTDYIGFRGEFERLFEYSTAPGTRGFCGLGTRFWVRNIRDGTLWSGVKVPGSGYEEDWLAIYPYVGAEGNVAVSTRAEAFFMTRIGVNIFTYESIPSRNLTLYPNPGPMTSVEVGLRAQHFWFSGYLDYMLWGRSGTVWTSPISYSYQPTSSMLTVGIKLAYSF